MRIIWSDDALTDLECVQKHISSDDAQAAAQVVGRLLVYAEEQLSLFPQSGRVGRVPDTLELVVPKLPYIVLYRIKNKQIEIVRMYHTSRRWPHDFS